MSKNILLGADPEAFVRDRGGKLMPIYGRLGGTKESPEPMQGQPKGFNYQEDGAAVEFNIPPTGSHDHFTKFIQTAMEWLSYYRLKNMNLEWAESSRIELAPEYLQDPRSRTIGCVSDHSAYRPEGLTMREPFSADDLGRERYAGGHLHISYNMDAMPPHVAARFMDLHVGLPSVEYDKQQGRRRFYGLPGLYRVKDYGIEYRTLSNWWLFAGAYVCRSMAMQALSFSRATYEARTVQFYQKAYATVPWNDVQSAITNEDGKLANMLIDFVRQKCDIGVMHF